MTTISDNLPGDERCSFCGKAKEDVDKLVQGSSAGVYICSGCIEICHSILAERSGSSQAFQTGAGWRRMQDFAEAVANLLEKAEALRGLSPALSEECKGFCQNLRATLARALAGSGGSAEAKGEKEP